MEGIIITPTMIRAGAVAALGMDRKIGEKKRARAKQTAVEKDDSFRVHMALHALEEPYREVFELRVFGELSFAQIGRIFRKTENWARVTFHRARAKLKERMENDE